MLMVEAGPGQRTGTCSMDSQGDRDHDHGEDHGDGDQDDRYANGNVMLI